MIGEIVPLVLVPRFTSYVGVGTYTTVALDVSAYYRARIVFIRGPLAGSPGAAFSGVIQTSPDAVLWTDVPGTTVTTVGTQSTMDVGPVVRYLRVKVTLTGDMSAVAAITVSVAGTLERRVE